MAYFNWSQKARIARSLLTRKRPVYVQYYLTARCNMACVHCNINRAHAGLEELNLGQIRALAANLRAIGVSIVLLIGGEPFMRKDLPEIVRIFINAGIHVRLQTNGLASREELAACVEAGAKDISISLDSLNPDKQEAINGGAKGSFQAMMQAVSHVGHLFPPEATAFFGSVLMPSNYMDIPNIIRFATAIGWGVSLVPVHVASPAHPPGFRTPNQACAFPPECYGPAARAVDACRALKREGYALYDSDEYLDDITRFVRGEPVQWRRRNGGVCDSPGLYFAITPAGDFAPCCDHHLEEPLPAYAPDFPRQFFARAVHRAAEPLTTACPGCMYGSYPEMTISARFLKPMLERVRMFSGKRRPIQRLSVDELLRCAREIQEEYPAEG